MKAPSKLYQKLLDASWPDLDVALRRLHDSVETVRAVGGFRVRRGGNRLARTMAQLARLPAAGEAVDVRLQVLRIPLPCRLSPYVVAWEKAVGDTDQIHVSVDVTLPLLGRLITYDGILTQVEAQQ
jgi:Domain of unknown function (DUF4166)